MKVLSTSRLLAACLLFAGCQVLPERPHPPAVHDFGPQPMSVAGPPSPWTAVSVAAPDWMNDPSIRYRLLYAQPTQVRFYALDRWVAPPPDLLASRLASRRSAGGYELKIELQSLEQTFQRPEQSTVLLWFHAHAVDPLDGSVAAEHNFMRMRPTRSADAAGAVEAFSLLVDQVERDLSDWIIKLPPPARTASSKLAEDP